MSETEQKAQKFDIWVPDDSILMENRTGLEQLRIAILGPPKGGKSRLAATAPKKPIYIFDFDGRLNSLAGMKGVIGKSYLESTNLIQSTAWMEVEKDLGMFEYEKSLKHEIPATFIFDSMTYMLDRAMKSVIVQSSSLRREIVIGSKKIYVPYKYDPYKAEMSLVSNILARTMELGVDVISVFHERAEEAPDSTEKEPKFTGKLSTHPPRAEELLPLFDEKWRITPDYGKYTVYTKPTSDFIGATCLEIDAEETPSIEAMIEKHKKRKGA